MRTYKGSRVTPRDVQVLKECMTGKWMKIAFGTLDRKDPKVVEKVGHSPGETLKKLQRLGVIDGVAPILTEKGRKIIEAVEMMNATDDSPLDEIFN